MLTRRSWKELTHRKARTFFTVATIATAVTGLWLFAVPPLIDAAMEERIESDLLWDVRLSPNGVVLTEADIAGIRDLPNVAGVEARVTTGAQMNAEGRAMDVWLVGVDDFADQEVNAVRISDGVVPSEGEVVSDPQNVRSGRYGGGVGDEVTLGGFPVTVSGIGGSLEFSATVDDIQPVLYLPLAPLQDAMATEAVNWIDVRLDNNEDHELVTATAESVRSYLIGIDAELTFWNVLEVRQPGDWPEKESFDNVIRLTYIIAALGLASALLMVYTTMNTIVREQTREIGILKAVGGTRRAIVRSYMFTAALLGGAGTAVGVVAGVFLSNLLVGFAGRQFSGVEAAFGAPLWVLGLSVLIGVGGTMVAALPAVMQATSMPVRDALGGHGVDASFGSSVDAALVRWRFVPRSVRLGLRNAVRRKARSATTAVQIGFAVGTFLGFFALAITVLTVAERSFDGEGGDIWVQGPVNAADTLAAVSGVADVVPVYYGDVGIDGVPFNLQGQTPGGATFHPDLAEGRWFTADEESSGAAVTVLGPAVAKTTGAAVGDVVAVESLGGVVPFEVVGVDTLMVNDGDVLFTPLSTAIALGGGEPGNYFVVTASSDEASVDAVAADIQDTLAVAGLGGAVETRYIEREAELSQNRVILSILMIVGVPVIAIGMIGLVNTMTVNIIERTREIGILRSIGARARHIRRMIRSEAMVLGLFGWAAAIPIGYAIGYLLVWLLSDSFGVDFDLVFPLWPLPLALVATLVVTWLVVKLPVRRAVRLRPGVALRYE